MRARKSSWPPSPWHDEPDKHAWVYCTYPCRIARRPIGAWCGYVTLPEHHPWVGLPYDEIPCTLHGGITFTNGAEIGFDCAHGGDLCPGSTNWGEYVVYRDMAYVIAQCEALARQAIAAEHAIT